MQQYPQIRLRIQPRIDLVNFAGQEVDVAIRWGNGRWKDCEITKLFNCPAWPTGNAIVFEQVKQQGVEKSFASPTLLRDRDDNNAWSEWFAVAGLKRPERIDALIIPDPNVRVQAVLDGQGIALKDELVSEEISRGKLYRLSDTALTEYGYYLAYDSKITSDNPAVDKFFQWTTKN